MSLRGHATVGGLLQRNRVLPCNGPSAGLFIHDTLDKSELIVPDIDTFELMLAANGCAGTYEDGPKERGHPPKRSKDSKVGFASTIPAALGPPTEPTRSSSALPTAWDTRIRRQLQSPPSRRSSRGRKANVPLPELAGRKPARVR